MAKMASCEDTIQKCLTCNLVPLLQTIMAGVEVEVKNVAKNAEPKFDPQCASSWLTGVLEYKFPDSASAVSLFKSDHLTFKVSSIPLLYNTLKHRKTPVLSLDWSYAHAWFPYDGGFAWQQRQTREEGGEGRLKMFHFPPPTPITPPPLRASLLHHQATHFNGLLRRSPNVVA